MTSSHLSNPAGTALPGPIVPPQADVCQCAEQRLARLIDHRRKAAAILAGLDLEIAMAVGDRDGARKHLKEMEAQTGARIAARQAGCFFDERGEADRQVYHGVIKA